MPARYLSPTFVLTLTLALGGFAMTVHGQNPAGYVVPTDGTLLTVAAQAEARRVPDVATISVGVVTQAADGKAAMRDNAEAMAKVMTAIKALDIADRDIQTSGVSLNPQYQYADGQAPRITGYQASNTVSLKVRDLTRLGEVLDQLSAQGANQIHGPGFEIDQPEPVYDEARVAALAKAQARAVTYARALDLRVRRIVSISEDGGGGFRPQMMSMAKAADGMEATPIAPGESEVSVNLQVVFELGK